MPPQTEPEEPESSNDNDNEAALSDEFQAPPTATEPEVPAAVSDADETNVSSAQSATNMNNSDSDSDPLAPEPSEPSAVAEPPEVSEPPAESATASPTDSPSVAGSMADWPMATPADSEPIAVAVEPANPPEPTDDDSFAAASPEIAPLSDAASSNPQASDNPDSTSGQIEAPPDSSVLTADTENSAALEIPKTPETPETSSLNTTGLVNAPVVLSPDVPAEPALSPATVPASADAVTSGALDQSSHSPKPAPKHRRKLLALVVAILVVIVLGGGSAAAYFGYYMNAGVIYRQSLGNMNKGYAALTKYLTTPSTTHYSGVKESGSFAIQSGAQHYDGSLTAENDGSNGQAALKLDVGVTKISLNVRSIKVPGATDPDVYIQANGIKSLGMYLGTDLGAPIDSLDGQWIVVDHNLLADIQSQIVKQQLTAGSKPQLSESDIQAFLLAVGGVNQQYVFTTNQNTAVTKVVKKYGFETIDGHKTYHYKVGFVPAHVKAYVAAMCAAVQHSKVASYIKQETGQAVASPASCKGPEASALKIKSSDTIDVWADVNSRLIYKIRVSDPKNPAQNFVDIGLNYKGNNSYPFFITGQDKSGSDNVTLSILTTLNTKTNALNFNITAADKGSSPAKFTGSFSFQPSNAVVHISAPAGAVPVTTVLSNLGLGDFTNQLQSLSGVTQTDCLIPNVMPLLVTQQ